MLKHLPNDFRDLVPGTPEWEAFADVTDRRVEMEAWNAGPVLHLAPLNKHEIQFFGEGRLYLHTGSTWTREGWLLLIESAEVRGISWIYLPDEEKGFVRALNIILSRFGYTVRARGLLCSERTGAPLGVIH